MTAPRIDLAQFTTADPAFTVIDRPATPRLDSAAADLVFRQARTGYRFTDQPVTDDQVAFVQELMEFPPTAMNTQPLRVLWVRSEGGRSRLLPLLAEGNRAKAESAPLIAVLAADTDFHDHLPRLLPHAPGARDRFLDDAAREQAARFNATLQAGYFILAARAAGLTAGPMGGFDAAGVDAEFFAGTGLRSFLVVNLGHVAADGTHPRSPRLAHGEVFLSA